MTITIFIANYNFKRFLPTINRRILRMESLVAETVYHFLYSASERFIVYLDLNISIISKAYIKELRLKNYLSLLDIIYAQWNIISVPLVISIERKQAIIVFVIKVFKNWFCQPISSIINYSPVAFFPSAIMGHEDIVHIIEELNLIKDKRDYFIPSSINGSPQFFFSPIPTLVTFIIPFFINGPFTLTYNGHPILKIIGVNILWLDNLISCLVNESPCTGNLFIIRMICQIHESKFKRRNFA